MLEALSRWLAKAQDRSVDEKTDMLLSARLADDMFPLSTQIRFACVQAYEGVCRLKGDELPALVAELLDEGRNAGEHPGSIAEAETRIRQTIGFLGDVTSDTSETQPQAKIAHALPNGMIFDLTPEQYARDWALPQFYFHVMSAYSIMRKEGVELGKADYVAHMFGYLRPGTAPES